MAIKLGSGAISKLYLGATEIQKAYLGSSLVYDAGGGGAFDADYQAVLNYATAQGYTLPSAGQQAKQNQLMLDLKSAGVFAKKSFIYVLATDGDQDFALINWKNPGTYNGLRVNSPTFITNTGYKGDGSSAYINTQYNINNNALNNAGHEAWVMAVPTIDDGILGSNQNNDMLRSSNSNFSKSTIQEQNTRPSTANPGMAGVGFRGVQRDNAAYSTYINNTTLTQMTTITTTTQGAGLIYLLWRFATYSNIALGYAASGENVIAEAGAYYSALNTYISSL